MMMMMMVFCIGSEVAASVHQESHATTVHPRPPPGQNPCMSFPCSAQSICVLHLNTTVEADGPRTVTTQVWSHSCLCPVGWSGPSCGIEDQPLAFKPSAQSHNGRPLPWQIDEADADLAWFQYSPVRPVYECWFDFRNGDENVDSEVQISTGSPNAETGSPPNNGRAASMLEEQLVITLTGMSAGVALEPMKPIPPRPSPSQSVSVCGKKRDCDSSSSPGRENYPTGLRDDTGLFQISRVIGPCKLVLWSGAPSLPPESNWRVREPMQRSASSFSVGHGTLQFFNVDMRHAWYEVILKARKEKRQVCATVEHGGQRPSFALCQLPTV